MSYVFLLGGRVAVKTYAFLKTTVVCKVMQKDHRVMGKVWVGPQHSKASSVTHKDKPKKNVA